MKEKQTEQPVVFRVNGTAKWITLFIGIVIIAAGWGGTAMSMHKDINTLQTEVTEYKDTVVVLTETVNRIDRTVIRIEERLKK